MPHRAGFGPGGSAGPTGLREKDLVLSVAHRLKRLLEERLGTEVVLTRQADVFVPLEERTAIANSKGADLFLSIHANSSRNRTASGLETYILSLARNREEIARRLPSGAFHLILAGHLHAGQIVLPFPGGKLRLAHLRARDVEGLYRYGPTALHVSSGLGTTFVPFRFFARPEVTELVVRSV